MGVVPQVVVGVRLISTIMGQMELSFSHSEWFPVVVNQSVAVVLISLAINYKNY